MAEWKLFLLGSGLLVSVIELSLLPIMIIIIALALISKNDKNMQKIISKRLTPEK